MIYSFKLCIMPISKNTSGVCRPKYIFCSHFSLVSLSIRPRSPQAAERIRQGERRWSRPPKTALERSDLTEKFQFRQSHTEAETEKTPAQIPVPSKKKSLYID